MADAKARGLRVREAGVAVVGVGSGRNRVGAGGGEGGVDGDGRVGPVVIACDNFDGARGACNRKNRAKFRLSSEKQYFRESTEPRKRREREGGKGKEEKGTRKGKGREAHLFAWSLLRYGRGAIGPWQGSTSLEPARLTRLSLVALALALLFPPTRRALLVLLVLLLLARTNSLKARLDPIHDPSNRRLRLRARRVRHALLDHLHQVGARRRVARVVRAL